MICNFECRESNMRACFQVGVWMFRSDAQIAAFNKRNWEMECLTEKNAFGICFSYKLQKTP